MKPIKSILFKVCLLSFLPQALIAQEEIDYSTAIRADYVFACMAANGQTYEILQKCSCSIDYIAARLSFREYEEAETIMRIQQDIGQRGVFYRETKWANDRLDKLKKVQAESTLACFAQ